MSRSAALFLWRLATVEVMNRGIELEKFLLVDFLDALGVSITSFTSSLGGLIEALMSSLSTRLSVLDKSFLLSFNFNSIFSLCSLKFWLCFSASLMSSSSSVIFFSLCFFTSYSVCMQSAIFKHCLLRNLLEKKIKKITTGTSLLDSIALALFAKFKEQIVSHTSSSEGLICTSIKTFEPYPLSMWL